MTKAETEGLRKVIGAALQQVPGNSSTATKLRRIGTAALSAREYSMQEATWLLTGLSYHQSLMHYKTVLASSVCNLLFLLPLCTYCCML